MSSPLFETIKQVFFAENWAFTEVPGREVLRAGFEARQSRVELHVQAFPELRAISVVSESSILPPGDPARRERAVELLMRLNQALTVGNFELNWDTGGVFFRATNLFADEGGDPGIIRGLVHAAIMETDHLAPLLSAIAGADGSGLAGLDVSGMIERAEAATVAGPESES